MFMRLTFARLLLMMAFGAMISTSVHAASPEDALVIRAFGFEQHGDPRAAIAILEPLANSANGTLSGDEKGRIWNLLGTSYQDLEMFEKARYCYEQAIDLLGPIRSNQAEFASALDNLGSVELSMGQLDASERLRKRAQKVYAGIKDHAGLARISNNLAIIAIRKNDRTAARRYSETALKESRNTTTLGDDDIASTVSVQGYLSLLSGNAQAALPAFEAAIDHWSRCHGPDSAQVGVGLVLRSRVYRLGGNLTESATDLQHALSIFAVNPGPKSVLYWATILQQAQVMRDQGLNSPARSLEVQATSALRDIDRQHCGTCTVPVEALR